MLIYIISAEKKKYDKAVKYAFPNYDGVISIINDDNFQLLLTRGYSVQIECIDSKLINTEHELEELVFSSSSKLKEEYLTWATATNICNTDGKINAVINLITDVLNGDITQDEFSIKYALQLLEFLNNPEKSYDNINLIDKQIYTTKSRCVNRDIIAARTFIHIKKNYPEAYEKFMSHLQDNGIVDEGR